MLTGVVIVLLALFAILAIPVNLTYLVCWRQTFQGDMTLQWLFGLVRLQLPLRRPTTPSSSAKKVARSNHKKLSSGRKSNPIAAIRQKSFRQRMIKFTRDFWHAIQKHNLTLRIRIGLGDPADTGQMWAIVGPVSGILAAIEEASIEIEPEFIDSVFELDSSGNIRVIPLQMIYLVFGLLLSPAIWQGIKQIRT